MLPLRLQLRHEGREPRIATQAIEVEIARKHRIAGEPVLRRRLEPLNGPSAADPNNDLFLSIARRATRSPKGKTKHADIDSILYGSR